MLSKFSAARARALSAVGYHSEHPLDETVWRRGWNDTKAGWLDWRFLLLDVAVAPTAGVILEPLVGVIVGVSGLIFVWIGATTRASLLQRNEARYELQFAVKGVFSDDAKQEALSQLSMERRVGVGLRNTGMDITPLDKEEDWWQRVQQWCETVCSRMDEIHPADRNNWYTLGDVHMRSFNGIGINRPGMQRKLSMLTQWCERLEDYINERTRQ